MNTKLVVIALLCASLGVMAKEAKKKGVVNAQVISARSDATGQHPGTAAVSGPTKITCTAAASSSPNSQPKPNCYINSPGFNGNLEVGQSAGTSGAGTVTLNCNGQGNVLTCSARIG